MGFKRYSSSSLYLVGYYINGINCFPTISTTCYTMETKQKNNNIFLTDFLFENKQKRFKMIE